jgi:PAS domain S-box-containing protein
LTTPTQPPAQPEEHSITVLEEATYREIFANLGVGFCVVRPIFDGGTPVDYEYLVANNAYIEQTGLSEPVGCSIRSLLPNIEHDWIELCADVALTGKRLRFEKEAAALSRWFSIDAFSIGCCEQRMVGVLVLNITERKRIERELAESEARFSALADGLPMPVWVLDADGVVRYVNSAYSEFFGLDIGNGVVPLWRDLLHPEDLAGFQYELSTALNQQHGMNALVRARRHDGCWRWLEMSATPRYSAGGRFIGLAGSSPDVTERREIDLAREQLLVSERVARNEAENMARVKDEFLATLSHELRTPLTTILGWSELMLQRMSPSDPAYKGLSVISSSAKVQRRLISDMLDLTGMLLGKVQLEVEPLDMCIQLREAISSQEPVAELKAHAISLSVPEYPCLVLGDATRIQQVLSNLLSNAIKFTPAHGHIDIAMSHEEDHFAINIRDSGEGIVAEFLPYLFGRFSQADGTTTRRHGGLGLGLAIVQQLLEMHGGTVSASSEGTGKGATFTVVLPEYQSEQGRWSGGFPRRGRNSERVLETKALRGLRLLVVEDQQDMREYLRRLLEEQGAQVAVTANATDALEILDAEQQHFDVLLTDIGMPGMDGYGLIRTIREDLGLDSLALPAIAVTGLARSDDRARALASGYQEHVAKPYSVPQLIAAVRSVCVS